MSDANAPSDNQREEHVLYRVTTQEALTHLQSEGDKGLSAAEARQRLQRYGRNSLPMRAGHGPLYTFIMQFHQPLIYILLSASLVTLLLEEYIDALVIFGVVLVNAIIGFLQEYKAAKALEALAQMTTTEARVIRDGQQVRLPSSELVPGDIVLLQSGDKVPADLRLIQCRDLQIDESALTGESVPVEKLLDPLPAGTALADRRNLAFSSSLVTYGQGRGVVFATGISTEVGRISDLVAGADNLETPLTRKIAEFSRLLLFVIMVLAVLTFAVGVMHGQSMIDMFMAAVALAVGAIPEGLPAAVTITLAIGVSRMARRRAIIRKLPAVETLGSTTTICSDKTGTLTVNQMTVRGIYAGTAYFDVSGSGYDPDGTIAANNEAAVIDNQALSKTLLTGLLCNDSALMQKEGRWEVNGDPTEGALLVSAHKAGLFENEMASVWPRLDVIPFESEYQYMATLHADAVAQTRTMYVKGAVEALLSRCNAALSSDGQTIPLDQTEIHRRQETMANEGLRVLAFACRKMPETCARIDHADIEQLTFLGLQGMIDPPRPEAIHAIASCSTAGIRVKMITGDHPVTARAIAAKLGLQDSATAAGKPLEALTSKDLANKSDQELVEIADRVSVFARATPEQKLRLVKALQGNGHVVAMTGDGVNDAPALKQADIGIAMGVGGTEVAKEASDMILTDDNFATIEAAVEEGRSVFDNLTKFIVWTLPTNMGEGLVIMAAIFSGEVLPLLPVQILWINMTTAVLLGLMLAFEPKEHDIMQRPPRDPKMPILNGVLIGRICIVGGIMLLGAFGSFNWAMQHEGYSEAAARTVAVNVFVIVELCYLFNCRSLTRNMFSLGLFSNPWVIYGSCCMILLQLAFTYLPIMNRMFQSAPIGWDAWWRILLTGLATYVVVGIEKELRRRFGRKS